MEIEPLEIFSDGQMPETYKKLQDLNVFGKLNSQFHNSFGVQDVIILDQIEQLDDADKKAQMSELITALSTRRVDTQPVIAKKVKRLTI